MKNEETLYNNIIVRMLFIYIPEKVKNSRSFLLLLRQGDESAISTQLVRTYVRLLQG